MSMDFGGGVLGAIEGIMHEDQANQRQTEMTIVNERAQERQNSFNSNEAVNSRNFNSAEAIAQRDWQEKMASTQYQRGFKDLQAAGINPMLMTHTGGSPAGQGSAASSTPASGHAVGSGTAGATGGGGFMAGAQSASQITVNDAVAKRTEAETDKALAEADEIRARTLTHPVSIEKMEQEVRESQERIHKIIQETNTSAYSASNLYAHTQNLLAELPKIKETVKLIQAQTNQTITQIGKTTAEEGEIRQRMKENLPEIQRAVAEMDAYARYLEMPRRGMDAATHQSFLGALSAVLRALNPFANLSGAIR